MLRTGRMWPFNGRLPLYSIFPPSHHPELGLIIDVRELRWIEAREVHQEGEDTAEERHNQLSDLYNIMHPIPLGSFSFSCGVCGVCGVLNVVSQRACCT
jgi:hypothetical protein